MCKGLYLDIDGMFSKDNDNRNFTIDKVSKTVFFLMLFLRVLFSVK